MQNRARPRRHVDPATERAAQNTATATAIIVALSSLNLSAYFYMVGSESLLPLFTSVGQYIIFPFAAVTSALYAVAAWRNYTLHRHRQHLLVRAVAETIGAVAVTAAVTLSMVYGFAASLAGPIIFATFLGAKTLYQAASAIFFAVQASRAQDPTKKAEYRERAKYAIYSTIAGAMTTAAVIAVDIFAKPVLSILGILAGAFAAAYSILKAVDIHLRARSRAEHEAYAANHQEDNLVPVNALTTTAQLTLAMPAQDETSIDLADDSDIPVDEYGFEMNELSQTSCATEVRHVANHTVKTAPIHAHSERRSISEVEDSEILYSISL